MIYYIAKTANSLKEFKMSFEDSKLGYYDIINPSYTLFNKDTKTFSSVYTEYNEDFHLFYKNCLEDMRNYSNSKSFAQNLQILRIYFIFPLSLGCRLKGFCLNIHQGFDYLLPIFTMGKYYQNSNQIFLPLAIQVNHRVCDGYHLGLFVNHLQNYLLNHWE